MSTQFRRAQQLAQGAYFKEHHPAHFEHEGSPYRLDPDYFALNLAPNIRAKAVRHFAETGIAWHLHANHGLSSQVCCLNFLMPLAQDPIALAEVVGRALGIAPPEMMPMESDESGEDWYVAFEWIGQDDYLNEAGKDGARKRGANATSTDAAVRFRHEGRIEIALIEWKFSEKYGAPISPTGNATRVNRYRDIAFAPNGPIRTDLGLTLEDFFWEPFYQMLRQQMLATQMQKASELHAERVRVVHISPAGNTDLHKVTAPALRRFGDDAFGVFGKLLCDPNDFVGWTIEDLFGLILKQHDNAWARYLKSRYTFFQSEELV